MEAAAMKDRDVSDQPGLVLASRDLLSKYGFNDGDVPEELTDLMDDVGQPPTGRVWDVWHDVLRQLVREHLLPVLEQSVEVVDIEDPHNPIRASKVDGADVTDEWSVTPPRVTLSPESVTVPYATVMDTIAERAAATG
jgi:hypothetical protein